MRFLIDRRRMASLILCAFGLTLSTRFAMAQDTKPLPKVFEQKVQLKISGASMSEALATLAGSAHVNILVDGEPLLLKADFDIDSSLHDSLDKVADVYDYSWTVSKGGSVLMSKRFKNPNERPQLYAREITRMAREIVGALTLVDFDKSDAHYNQLISRLGHSLSPEKLKMLSSDKGLHGSDLTPEQKQMLQQAFLFNALNRHLLDWQGMLIKLEGMETSALSTRKHPVAQGDINRRSMEYTYTYHAPDGSEHSFDFPGIMFSSSDSGTVVTP